MIYQSAAQVKKKFRKFFFSFPVLLWSFGLACAFSFTSAAVYCPSFLEDFFERQKTECQLREGITKAMIISPMQGFGNQINGVLQGIFAAAIFKRCLHINWKYGSITDPLYQLNLVHTKSVKKGHTGKKVRFPRSSRSYRAFSKLHQHEEEIYLIVHYRDFLCSLLNSEHLDKLEGLHIFQNEREKKFLREREELCLFYESCILRGFMESGNQLPQDMSIGPHYTVALHIRSGDSIAFTNKSHDKRIPLTELPLFWKAAENIGKSLSRNPLYFLASDSLRVVEEGKKYFGEQIFTTLGVPSHSDLEAIDRDAKLKVVQDWVTLAEAKVVLHGPWSTFTEKALVYKHYQKKERIIVKCTRKAAEDCPKYNVIEESMEWFCFRSILKDSPKGPRSVCDHFNQTR